MNNASFSLYKVFGYEPHHFQGNTAAVVELTRSLSSAEMQKMAADFNQPATTFLWPSPTTAKWHTRWFAPDSEIELCGHGAMAAIAYLTSQGNPGVTLTYNSGEITGHQNTEGSCTMEIEAIEHSPATQPETALMEGINTDIIEYYPTRNKHIVVVQDEQAVRGLKPDFHRLKDCRVFGFIVTAPGTEADFVSRTLVPHVQQLEDHATGSSHAVLTPFWSSRLGITKMTAYQLSKRGGRFLCELRDGKVLLSGECKCRAQGKVVVG